MILCVEERDWSASTGDRGNGWTHFFSWPKIKKIGEFWHGSTDPDDPDYSNDSGQSVCIGSLQFQITCSDKDPYPFKLRNFFNPSQIIGKWDLRYPGDSSFKMRSLGVTRQGNIFYAMNWYYKDNEPNKEDGLHRMWIQDGYLYDELITDQFVGNNIGQKNGLLYIASETDDFLHVVDVNGNIKNTIQLPYKGDGHWRGSIWLGDVFLTSNTDTRSVYIFDHQFNIIMQIDMSQYLHDGGNIIPYGLWSYPFEMQ